MIKALTFDLFGTVLDLGGSLTPPLAAFLRETSSAEPARVWAQWRARQRIEQYQDSLLQLGHSGYLETARRAFVYTLRLNGIEATPQEVGRFMENWKLLSPFPDVEAGLKRLGTRHRLVALSNGDTWFLDHLVKNRIEARWDTVISVDLVGVFKPHPAVYRRAARELGLETHEIMMVSSNSFDVMGARACGMQGAYVNREGLPYEDTPYLPDITVKDFAGLAEALDC